MNRDASDADGNGYGQAEACAGNEVSSSCTRHNRIDIVLQQSKQHGVSWDYTHIWDLHKLGASYGECFGRHDICVSGFFMLSCSNLHLR